MAVLLRVKVRKGTYIEIEVDTRNGDCPRAVVVPILEVNLDKASMVRSIEPVHWKNKYRWRISTYEDRPRRSRYLLLAIVRQGDKVI